MEWMDVRNPRGPMGRFKQRRHVRFAADMPIQISAIRGVHADRETGRMVDVSEGGLCYVGARYHAPGTIVNIEFQDCRMVGQVRHCRMREYGSHVQFVVGVQIQQVLDGLESWKSLTQSTR